MKFKKISPSISDTQRSKLEFDDVDIWTNENVVTWTFLVGIKVTL